MSKRRTYPRRYPRLPDTRTPPPANCRWCNGTGFVYVDQAGNQLTWDERQPSDSMKRCQHVGAVEQQLDFEKPQTTGYAFGDRPEDLE